jgi:hypothetical protein
MKSFLIMVLMTALAAAACYTRPGRRELVFFLLDTQSAQEGRSWRKSDLEKADKIVKQVTIKDRWLWVDAEVDGQVIYTGCFAHWYPRTEKAEKGGKSEKATVMEVARMIGNF